MKKLNHCLKPIMVVGPGGMYVGHERGKTDVEQAIQIFRLKTPRIVNGVKCFFILRDVSIRGGKTTIERETLLTTRTLKSAKIIAQREAKLRRRALREEVSTRAIPKKEHLHAAWAVFAKAFPKTECLMRRCAFEADPKRHEKLLDDAIQAYRIEHVAALGVDPLPDCGPEPSKKEFYAARKRHRVRKKASFDPADVALVCRFLFGAPRGKVTDSALLRKKLSRLGLSKIRQTSRR